MNNFELFKWKKAGLTNLNVNKVLAYQEKHGKIDLAKCRCSV